MVCKNSNHSPHCPSYKNNALKGASAVNQPKQLMFNSSELNLLSKSLEVCRYFITKNQSQYQNPQDIVNEISILLVNIINARQNNNNKSNLKGASSVICNETKIQSLQNILKQFNLIQLTN